MAGQGPHQRSGLAFGTQRGVDRPDRALAGRGRARLHHARGEVRRRLERLELVAALDRLGDEDDVHVADVVQLPPAALAHADDGQATRLRGHGQPGAGDRERRVERGGGEVGQLGGDLLEPGRTREVAGRQREQPAPVLDAQVVQRARAGGVGDRRRRVRVGADGREHARAQHLGGVRRALVAVEQAPVLRVLRQVVARARYSCRGRRSTAARKPGERRIAAIRSSGFSTSARRTSPASARSGSAASPSDASSSGSVSMPSTGRATRRSASARSWKPRRARRESVLVSRGRGNSGTTTSST